MRVSQTKHYTLQKGYILTSNFTTYTAYCLNKNKQTKENKTKQIRVVICHSDIADCFLQQSLFYNLFNITVFCVKWICPSFWHDSKQVGNFNRKIFLLAVNLILLTKGC